MLVTAGLVVAKKKKPPGKRGRRPGGGDDVTSRMTEAELEAFVAGRRASMPPDLRVGPVIGGVTEFSARLYGKLAVPVKLNTGRKQRPPSEW